MARQYLARDLSLFQIEAELARYRAAAERLVVTEQRRNYGFPFGKYGA